MKLKKARDKNRDRSGNLNGVGTYDLSIESLGELESKPRLASPGRSGNYDHLLLLLLLLPPLGIAALFVGLHAQYLRRAPVARPTNSAELTGSYRGGE